MKNSKFALCLSSTLVATALAGLALPAEAQIYIRRPEIVIGAPAVVIAPPPVVRRTATGLRRPQPVYDDQAVVEEYVPAPTDAFIIGAAPGKISCSSAATPLFGRSIPMAIGFGTSTVTAIGAMRSAIAASTCGKCGNATAAACLRMAKPTRKQWRTRSNTPLPAADIRAALRERAVTRAALRERAVRQALDIRQAVRQQVADIRLAPQQALRLPAVDIKAAPQQAADEAAPQQAAPRQAADIRQLQHMLRHPKAATKRNN